VYVHAPTPIQAKAFLGLTKEKAMKMDPKELRGHCDAFKVLPKAMIPGLKDCSPEMSKTLSMAVAVCGSGSGTPQISAHMLVDQAMCDVCTYQRACFAVCRRRRRRQGW
jgi:hypothetical protein